MTRNSGDVVRGGVVCYAVDLKKQLFGILRALIDQFTVESAEITRELANRLNAIIPADIAAAITGVPDADEASFDILMMV